jgi:cell division protein ZapE
MNLLNEYQKSVDAQLINDDPQQREIIIELQCVVDHLVKPRRHWWGGKKTAMGLYLYGSVGVGKTYLMDFFYQYAPIPAKSRFHFHHFMQQVDAQLRRLQGQKDPLKRIVADLAKSTRLLCLDEFLVHDVADAMILSQILNALFAQGVVLVVTGNTRPDDLYLGGAHREHFLPAIDLLKTYCHVMRLENGHDYRLGHAPLDDAYLFPLNHHTEQALTQQFDKLSQQIVENINLPIQNRFIPCVKCSDHAVWFTFDVLCNVPRCQLDYLEIADKFDTVFLSGVPALTADDTSRVVLFIHFIDVMYDRGIRLVISAAVPCFNLYLKGAMLKSFQRTLSRLEEMQSIDYLRRHARLS